ncbi:hypothetical protein ACS0TY_024956 [Phlomoides rotata]
MSIIVHLMAKAEREAQAAEGGWTIVVVNHRGRNKTPVSGSPSRCQTRDCFVLRGFRIHVFNGFSHVTSKDTSSPSISQFPPFAIILAIFFQLSFNRNRLHYVLLDEMLGELDTGPAPARLVPDEFENFWADT